jgi:hypothetical protein
MNCNFKNRNDKYSMNNLDALPKTIICDIDGCILKHMGNLYKIQIESPILLNGVKEKFDEWEKKAYKIILLTGRKESMREITEIQLKSQGLFWDVLIMGATRGQRVLINDLKPSCDTPTAYAVNLQRDQGLIACENV